MKFIGQISAYTFIGFLGAGISFLLLPYLSHFLSPKDYGVLSMINSVVTILIPFISIMAFSWINAQYFKVPEKKEFASLFTTVQLVPVVPFLIITLVCYLFKNPIGIWLEVPAEKNYWIPLSVAIAFLTIYFETLVNLTVAQQKPFTYGFFNISKLLLEIGLTIYFVAVKMMGWEGRLLAWIISVTFSFIIGTIYFYREGFVIAAFNPKYFYSSILFGAPLILHTVGKFIINQSDRIFITKMVSLDEAGVYSIGYQVGIAILLFVNAAGNFFQPYLFERLTKNDSASKLQIVKTTYLLILLFVAALIVLTIFSPILFSWFIDERYAAGVQYVFWVGLSYLFWGVYTLMTGYIFYSGQSQYLGKLAILNIVLNGILNYVFISNFGAMGAAYATCISFFIIALLVSYKANRIYPMPWKSFKELLHIN
jgi:O-antigen/teichoic acid export membrane protein